MNLTQRLVIGLHSLWHWPQIIIPSVWMRGHRAPAHFPKSRIPYQTRCGYGFCSGQLMWVGVQLSSFSPRIWYEKRIDYVFHGQRYFSTLTFWRHCQSLECRSHTVDMNANSMVFVMKWLVFELIAYILHYEGCDHKSDTNLMVSSQ